MIPITEHLDFCTLEFYDNYVISVINEGEIIDNEKLMIISTICEKYFTTTDFVYISLRKYNYSINPEIYSLIGLVENLKGFAIVSDNYFSNTSGQLEQNFLNNKAFNVFESLKEAKKWVEILFIEA